MSTTRVRIEFEDDEYRAVVEMAERDLRTFNETVRFLVRQAAGMPPPTTYRGVPTSRAAASQDGA